MKTKIFLLILFTYSFVSAQQYGSWHEIDTLHIFRVGHGLAVLPNGNVLLGGNDYFFGEDSCEIYDIITKQWRYTDSMNITRSNPKMITLNTGKVLVAGSYRDRSCELFDPNSETWTMTDSIPTYRFYGQTVTKLIDGRVLVAGGQDTDTTTGVSIYLKNVDIFNPSTEKWTIAAPMLIPRNEHTATLLDDGRVLVTGGINADSLGLRECEIYDPIANSWETVAPMNDIRYTHSALLLQNGNVFVSGGPSVQGGDSHWLLSTEVYNVQNNTWTYTGDMANLRSGNKMYYLSAINKILILGGAIGQVSIEDTWEIFDPISLVSLYSKPFPISQSLSPILSLQSNSTQLKNGNIIVAGGSVYGISQSGMLWVLPTKRCWEFDVVTDVAENDLKINDYKLLQNYPNPFNPGTNIKFIINVSSALSLIIYNVEGKEIKRIINHRFYNPGTYSVYWNGITRNGNKAPSGVYFYSLISNGQLLKTKSMVLLK